jgi:short-subunit dehydrogenase
MAKEKRRTALITGASAGIGRAFARAFAKRGFDVVLVARRKERLDELAAELHSQYNVSALTLAYDLARPETPRSIAADLAAQSVQVDVLVNNAGYGLGTGFIGSDWQTHADFIQVMMTSYAELCHRFLPGMVRNGYGRIINVASIAAFLPPLPGSLYSTAKSFLVNLSWAISREFKSRGVYTTALCPGFTHSEFHDVLGNRDEVSKFPKFMWMDAETVAEQGVDAVMRGKVVYVNGFINRVITGLARIVPMGVAEKLLGASPYKDDVEKPAGSA